MIPADFIISRSGFQRLEAVTKTYQHPQFVLHKVTERRREFDDPSCLDVCACAIMNSECKYYDSSVKVLDMQVLLILKLIRYRTRHQCRDRTIGYEQGQRNTE